MTEMEYLARRRHVRWLKEMKALQKECGETLRQAESLIEERKKLRDLNKGSASGPAA